MRKLSDIHGDEAIDVVADLIEPIADLAGDKDVKALFAKEKPKDGESVNDYNLRRLKTIAPKLLKTKKAQVIEIMAIIDGKSIEDFNKTVNVFTLPALLLQNLADKELVELFTSATLTESDAPSGVAQENTKE